MANGQIKITNIEAKIIPIASASHEQKTILIAGDWFVDEYWFIVRHYSMISSHTGPLHYRIYSKHGDPVKDLCGGGLVARVVYEIRGEPDKASDLPFEIVGLGSWHPMDRDLIAHFIHAKCRQATGSVICNSYAIMPSNCRKPVWVTLHNLQDPDNPFRGQDAQKTADMTRSNRDDQSGAAPKGATVRVIRSYRFDGRKFEQLNRIDWEPIEAFPSEVEREHAISTIENIQDFKKPLHAILIEDHKKGVVDEKLIDLIMKRADESTLFCIRTKNRDIFFGDKQVDWFKALSKKMRDTQHNNTTQHNNKQAKTPRTIELLALGPEISTRFYPTGGLLTNNGQIARHAYELIKSLKERFKLGHNDTQLPEINNIVLTSDKLELIVVVGDDVYVWRPLYDIKNIELEKLNWTSAFFASLAYERFREKFLTKSTIAATDLQLHIARAIGNAQDHSGVKDPIVFEAEKHKQKNEVKRDQENDASGISQSNILEQKIARNINHQRWADVDGDWDAATKEADMGILKSPKRLQIWRASTDLPEYIACVEGKREAIKRLWDKMLAFKMSLDIEKSCSILLEADPGVGKTFLARMLAETLKFRIIQHDITQMIHREELLDLFDMVATAQAEQESRLVVFVDEINATLDGSPVYGAFLSPLEAGYYMRRGTKFKLKPCIWIFAGTKRKDNDDSGTGTEKLKDFESRLSAIERIDYRSLQILCLDNSRKNNREELKLAAGWLENVFANRNSFSQDERNKLDKLDLSSRLEQVYLGAKMVNQTFCDVREIEEQVLEVFYKLDPADAPARLIGRLVMALQNVQYGRIRSSNCIGVDWDSALKKTNMKFGKSDVVKLDFG